MSDADIPASLAEAMAEIRRLRGERSQAALSTYVPPEYVSIPKAELERLHARIAELEATHAVTLGTLEQPTDDAPFHLEHDVPPSTPR